MFSFGPAGINPRCKVGEMNAFRSFLRLLNPHDRKSDFPFIDFLREFLRSEMRKKITAYNIKRQNGQAIISRHKHPCGFHLTSSPSISSCRNNMSEDAGNQFSGGRLSTLSFSLTCKNMILWIYSEWRR